jgi:hypothetical protein
MLRVSEQVAEEAVQEEEALERQEMVVQAEVVGRLYVKCLLHLILLLRFQ